MTEGKEASGDNVTPIHNEPGNVPPAAPRVPTLPLARPAGSDSRARKESKGYANRDLDGEARANDHDRIESLRWHLHLAEKIIFWLAVFLLAAGLIVWSMHQLLPDAWSFLKPDQLTTIQHILTTVAVSGLVGNVARRVMKSPSDKRTDGGEF